MFTQTRTLLAVLATGAATLLLAGCPSKSGPTPQTSGTSGSPPAATAGGLVAEGASPGTGGDPCALITAAEIQAAVGQSVTKITRLPVDSDSDGTSQQCLFATNGTPPSGAAAALLAQMAAGFGVGSGSSFTSAGIGVILHVAAGSGSPEPVDTSELPPGAKVIAGLGDFAVAVPSPLSAGGAAICAVGNRALIIIAIEGRATPVDQLEALLRAGVPRL
jgi:hypothetical protein